MTSTQACAVDLRNIVKAFGSRRALDHVDLQLPQGCFLTLFGPNGAGKTTLLRIIATLDKPSSGAVHLLGYEDMANNLVQIRQQIGLISHKSMLYADLTAAENLRFAGRLYGLSGAALEQRIAELLALVELDHRAHDQAGTFSRGMTQRLSLARALVNDPQLVLLDEPYAGLDQHGMRLLDELIGRIRQGRTFVMVSHDLERGYELCTHALILARGQVVLGGAKEDVDTAAFRQAYFSVVGNYAAGGAVL